MGTKPFHLAYFMCGTTVQGWNKPYGGQFGKDWGRCQFHVEAAQTLERGKFDFILWEDLYYVPNHWKGKADIFLERAISVPRIDTMALTPYVAAQTSRIGLIPTLPTFAYHPYLMARMIGSLDALSGGRGGWNIVTGTVDQAAKNFGYDGLEDVETRYERAIEYTDLVKKLWDSWERGAVIADPVTGIFTDPSKVHEVKFDGKYYHYDGTSLISGEAPQGHPVIAQAGASPAGRRLAATHSDVIVAPAKTVEDMKQYQDDVRAHMVSLGRNPADCKVLFLISPFIGHTQEEAEARRAMHRGVAAKNVDEELADMSKRLDIDLSVLPLDEPLGPDILNNLHTGGHVSYLEKFVKKAEGKTLREVAISSYARDNDYELCGSFEAVADEMQAIVEEIGGDGFLISQHVGDHTRRYLNDLVDGLVPELQRRGVVRQEYTHPMLRENLLEY